MSDPTEAAAVLQRAAAAVEAVVHGKRDLVQHVLTAALAGGHVLLEDVPGVGKTTLGQAVAQALGCSFHRVQFTADLLPSDIVGAAILQGDGFRFVPGPLFAQVVLADEINRTPPRTQSALLEAMEERQVSVDGVVHPLPAPFFVLATQNPLEQHGTFPLPESQVDRFLMRLQVGYPDRESERRLLREAASGRAAVAAVLDPGQMIALQAAARGVALHEELEDAVLSLVRATREHPAIRVGASPRAAQALARAMRARALLAGRAHAIPDDLLAVAEPVLGHRLVAAPRADGRDGAVGAMLVRELLADLPLPR